MSVLSNMNYIKRAMRFPCHPTGPLLVFEAALNAAGATLYAMNTFSCLDIVKARAGISWRCGRLLKAAARQGFSPAAIEGGELVYKLTAEWLEKGLWYWFLADQASAFAANWMSVVAAESGCREPPAGQLHGITAGASVVGGVGQATVNFDLLGSSSCITAGISNWAVHAGCQANVAWHLPVRPYSPDLPLATISSWIQPVGGGTVYPGANSSGANAPNYTGTGGGVFGLSGGFTGTTYELKTATGGGYAIIGPGSISIEAEGHAVDFPPTGCIPGGR